MDYTSIVDNSSSDADTNTGGTGSGGHFHGEHYPIPFIWSAERGR